MQGGTYRKTFNTGVEVQRSDLSSREAGTANFTYEDDDILGSAVKLAVQKRREDRPL